MARAKRGSDDLDQKTLATLKNLIVDLQAGIEKFQKSLDYRTALSSLSTDAETIYQLSGAIRDKMPKSSKGKGPRQICQHAYFVKRYVSEKNRSQVERNFSSLKIELKNVEEEILRLESALKGDSVGIEGSLGFIKDPATRSYVEESHQCFQAGAFRASIVMAGCALESMIRAIYRQVKGTDSLKLPFSRVIEILEEDRHLQPDQSAIVNVCRSFRNLTGHPSGFRATKEEASSLISLSLEQLKKS